MFVANSIYGHSCDIISSSWRKHFASVFHFLLSLYWLPEAACNEFKTLLLLYKASPYLQAVVQTWTPAFDLCFAPTSCLAAPTPSMRRGTDWPSFPLWELQSSPLPIMGWKLMFLASDLFSPHDTFRLLHGSALQFDTSVSTVYIERNRQVLAVLSCFYIYSLSVFFPSCTNYRQHKSCKPL